MCRGLAFLYLEHTGRLERLLPALARRRKAFESSEMTQAVVFDLFGTLVDSFRWDESELVFSEMTSALGAPRDGFIRLWRETDEGSDAGAFPSVEARIVHICKEQGVRLETERITKAARLSFEFTRRQLSPRPDAMEMITQLKAKGLKIGLISNCGPEIPTLWRDTPLAPLVDVAILSCVVGLKKPDPRIYGLACDGLEVSPKECVYVGDGGSGELTGAAQVGMRPILINVPYEDLDDPYRTDAKDWRGPTISALKEVLALVEL